jgi:hypothetical protein
VTLNSQKSRVESNMSVVDLSHLVNGQNFNHYPNISNTKGNIIVLFVETPRKFLFLFFYVCGVSTNKTIICFIAMQTYKELTKGNILLNNLNLTTKTTNALPLIIVQPCT